MRKLLVAAVAAAMAVAGFAVIASAGPGQQGTSWEFKFSKKGENKPTGSNSILEPAKIDDQGTSDTSDDRYIAPSKSVIKFPKQSNINTRAKPRCKESPSDVQAGRESCPGRTRIGRGVANAVTGQSDTSAGTEIVSPIQAFNLKNGIMFVVDPCSPGPPPTGPGTGRPCDPIPGGRIVLIGTWSKVNTRPTLTVPTPPALLRGGVVITRFQLKTGRYNSPRGSYATTPDTCRNDVWKSQAVETYEDGSRQKINDLQPCNG